MWFSLFKFIALYSLVYCQDITITTDDGESTSTESSTTEATTSIPIIFLSDNYDTVSWSPKSTQSVIIEALEGYKISVNVTKCDIDGENGDYATITTEENTDGLMFTYGIKRHPAYLYNNNRLLGDFFGTNASNFTVVFTLVGEAMTTVTTEVPTTSIILPTPEPFVSSTLLVYLAGRSAKEYLDPSQPEPLILLRDAIGAMAAEYCENENFPLNGSVTYDNVVINHLVPCSLGWPSSGSCIQLNFSVPVNLIEDPEAKWQGYQLTTDHLRIMWSRYAKAYLPDDTTIYHPPNDDNFAWGLIALLGGTIIFAMILVAIRHYGMKVSKMMRRRKLSDTASIISTSDRNSQISLPPHYLQETPALFENAYPMYNPDKNPEYSESSYANSFQYPDYQDLSLNLDQNIDENNDVEESGA